jgi:hypothetical protein
MRRSAAILLTGISILVSSSYVAHAGTLTDLNAQLASLNISATELSIPCISATNQSNLDVSMVNDLRQKLVVDEATPTADGILNDFLSLNSEVIRQESDQTLMLNACLAVKLNQVDIDEIEDKLARIASLPGTPTEEMKAAAANGSLIAGGCDFSPQVEQGATIEILQSDGTWEKLPLQAQAYIDTKSCGNGTHFYMRYVISDLPAGTAYKWYMPFWNPPVVDTSPNYIPDYFSQYARQKQQIISDAKDAKATYTNVWNAALLKDIQSSINVVSPLITALDKQIKSQAVKYPKNASAYQQIISSEPIAPTLGSDTSAALPAAVKYLGAVSAFQAGVPTKLDDLIPKPVTFQCVNGKKTKKITALSPRCPVGYKIKK